MNYTEKYEVRVKYAGTPGSAPFIAGEYDRESDAVAIAELMAGGEAGTFCVVRISEVTVATVSKAGA